MMSSLLAPPVTDREIETFDAELRAFIGACKEQGAPLTITDLRRAASRLRALADVFDEHADHAPGGSA